MEITRERDLGVDIVAKRAAEESEKERRRQQTCDWLFNLYMEHEGEGVKSAKEKWRLYNREIKPKIGSRCIHDLSHDDLANLLQEKLAESESVSNALQALIRRWFRWSVTLGRHMSGLKANPASDLVKLAKPRSRSRFLTDYEIKLLFKAIDITKTKLAGPIRLILYTGVRRAEAFELPFGELDLLDRGMWVIPGSRTKNAAELLLPLPVEMVEMLRAVPREPGQRLVWPGGGDPNKPMSGYSKALTNLQKEMVKLALLDGRMVEPWSIHDLRRTVATGMNGLHDGDDRPLIPSIVIERVINHKLPGMQGVYNRWDYMAEKKAALRIWANHLAYLRRVTPVE